MELDRSPIEFERYLTKLILKWIRERSNSIKEISNSIRELSN